MMNAIVSPNRIGAKYQLGVWGLRNVVMSTLLEFCNQRKPRIHAAIGDNPGLAIQAERLVFTLRFRAGLEERVAEADRPVYPNVLRVRAAELLKLGQSFQQRTIHGFAVKVEDAGEAAHEISELCSGNAASNVA
jgi:hypothetical protein